MVPSTCNLKTILVIDAKFSRRKPFEEHCFFGAIDKFLTRFPLAQELLRQALRQNTRDHMRHLHLSLRTLHASSFFCDKTFQIIQIFIMDDNRYFNNLRGFHFIQRSWCTWTEREKEPSERNAQTDADRPYMRAIAKHARFKNRM